MLHNYPDGFENNRDLRLLKSGEVERYGHATRIAANYMRRHVWVVADHTCHPIPVGRSAAVVNGHELTPEHWDLIDFEGNAVRVPVNVLATLPSLWGDAPRT